MIIILQQDMEVRKIQALVKVGRQIISMTLLEIVMNSHKKRTTPTAELAEEASVASVALSFQLLIVSTAILPTSTASIVLALLYI